MDKMLYVSMTGAHNNTLAQRAHANNLANISTTFLGASEALNGLPEKYQMVQCSPGIIYKAK